jgi:hypothetical protein
MLSNEVELIFSFLRKFVSVPITAALKVAKVCSFETSGNVKRKHLILNAAERKFTGDK